ncbi:hypothetical protein ID855_19345 [Xenorhabdus sp. ZM]|uniref:hypothetical protein n=1 Tax=Xenorhabdus szentirmaii TaxID=290112 RepID=UPI00199FF7CD|nr:hypothetical protein [Xenorhabdus sp. ZM]MBD2806794.1 hypothetical protein [Xenorhabdus sp. ZM]
MVNKKTKKMLVAYNPNKPDSRRGNFIIPLILKGERKFINIKNGKSVDYGLVVFIGKDITANDIFDKLKSSNVNEINDSMLQIELYINSVNEFKIGDIIRINENSELVIVPKLGTVKKSKLP